MGGGKKFSNISIWVLCVTGMLSDVHINDLFVYTIQSERFEHVHLELFLSFPLSVRPKRIIVNNYWCHIFQCVTIVVEIFFFLVYWFFFGRGVLVMERWLLICLRSSPMHLPFDMTLLKIFSCNPKYGRGLHICL